jgi:hypothetical protein
MADTTAGVTSLATHTAAAVVEAAVVTTGGAVAGDVTSLATLENTLIDCYTYFNVYFLVHTL